MKNSDNGEIFGAWTQARLYFGFSESNDFRDSTSFLFNLKSRKTWKCKTTFDDTLETVDSSSKWVFFSEHDDVHDLAIRNTNGFQAAASRAGLRGYMVDRDGSGINLLTKSADGKEVKLSVMEIWEL